VLEVVAAGVGTENEGGVDAVILALEVPALMGLQGLLGLWVVDNCISVLFPVALQLWEVKVSHPQGEALAHGVAAGVDGVVVHDGSLA
jgi:hypothetical protein